MAAAPWGPCLNGQGTGKGKYGDGDSFRGAPSFRGWDPPHEMGHWQTLTVPLFHCPLGTKEATPNTPHLSPAQEEHWGSRWVSPDLSALPPENHFWSTFGQTGPTGKISQELI